MLTLGWGLRGGPTELGRKGVWGRRGPRTRGGGRGHRCLLVGSGGRRNPKRSLTGLFFNGGGGNPENRLSESGEIAQPVRPLRAPRTWDLGGVGVGGPASAGGAPSPHGPSFHLLSAGNVLFKGHPQSLGGIRGAFSASVLDTCEHFAPPLRAAGRPAGRTAVLAVSCGCVRRVAHSRSLPAGAAGKLHLLKPKVL